VQGAGCQNRGTEWGQTRMSIRFCSGYQIKSYQSGVYLKISEPISLTGSAGGRAKTEPLFRPPRLACPTEAVRRREAEAKRTISSFSFRF